MKKLEPVERIYLSHTELEKMERDILNRRHIERYAMIRQWCHGNVLDFACGCGYGANLVSKNPDVDRVYGVDIDQSAIEWANQNFANTKTEFICQDINDFDKEIDVLVCLETIEHIKDQMVIPDLAERLKIKNLFISFPSKKTTHYNKFHFYDYTTEEICGLLKNYTLNDEIDLHREVKILNFVRK
jgi:2-polyprenyl-3-methyl-5-hydroxy-6-metoxy-1,4-benzoquinol methylase